MIKDFYICRYKPNEIHFLCVYNAEEEEYLSKCESIIIIRKDFRNKNIKARLFHRNGGCRPTPIKKAFRFKYYKTDPIFFKGVLRRLFDLSKEISEKVSQFNYIKDQEGVCDMIIVNGNITLSKKQGETLTLNQDIENIEIERYKFICSDHKQINQNYIISEENYNVIANLISKRLELIFNRYDNLLKYYEKNQ